MVLQLDARNEEKGKHGKFENLWKGPYRIFYFRGKNDFLLEESIQEGQPMVGLSSTTMSENSPENSSSLYVPLCILFPTF